MARPATSLNYGLVRAEEGTQKIHAKSMLTGLIQRNMAGQRSTRGPQHGSKSMPIK